MTDRDEFLLKLDDELLKGGVLLSEWCSRIVYEADIAFTGGADLATILTAVSGIETYLRSESPPDRRARFFDLIESSAIDSGLKASLHKLRKYRNSWVHVEAPWSDEPLLERPSEISAELEKMAFLSVRLLRRTVYSNQWV